VTPLDSAAEFRRDDGRCQAAEGSKGDRPPYAGRRRIRPWYRLGGIGFVLSVVGGLAAIAGLLMAR